MSQALLRWSFGEADVTNPSSPAEASRTAVAINGGGHAASGWGARAARRTVSGTFSASDERRTVGRVPGGADAVDSSVMLRVLAVEDEAPQLEELLYLLRADPRVTRAKRASDSTEALRRIGLAVDGGPDGDAAITSSSSTSTCPD
jgi:hypothetical protein